MPLTTQGNWFFDSAGRRLLLRGVNLGGSTKLPKVPDGATHIPTDYQDHRTVSFVGRPFPLSEADEHYRRLRAWGFNCLRFLTTWEAIEHGGPGQYDEAYLDYLYAAVKKAGEYGFYVFIDPHQDVWSRMSGGDGAPGWTLEATGLHPGRIDASEAAVTMAGRYPNYPRMVWFTNAHRLASATLFTLFFAGDRFAPQMRVAGEGIQNYLQRHFIGAMEQVAERMHDLPHVIGYDSMNEPNPGYIGVERLSAAAPRPVPGPLTTYFDGMVIPAGIPRDIPWQDWVGFSLDTTHTVRLNPQGVCAWLDPQKDIWRAHGVWDLDAHGQPHLLRDDYFAGVQFFAECVRPFIKRYADHILPHHPEALIFIEGEPISLEPLQAPEGVRVVHASHWYDNFALFTKHFDPTFTLDAYTRQFIQGEENVQKMYDDQIGMYVGMSDAMGGVPTLIGEFGLQFDLDEGQAYQTGDYSQHVRALSMYYAALDKNLAHSTQWNYTADNSNQWGDLWNQEDLSIFSRSQQTNPDDIFSGGRAVEGFCRPFFTAAAGTPIEQRFDAQSRQFTLTLEVDVPAATCIFVPRIQYPQGAQFSVTSGQVHWDEIKQTAEWVDAAAGRQTLTIQPKNLHEKE